MKKLPVIPLNPVSSVISEGQSLINAWKDYSNTKEIEKTKRDQISANRDVALSSIKEQAEILRNLIEGTFSERAKNFDKYFTMLENGFSSGNDQQINAAMTMIVEQTKVSPMLQAGQLISKINDPNNSDVIEI